MNRKTGVLLIIILVLPALSLVAQTLRVAQVDTGNLLLKGQVDAYVSLANAQGDVPASVDPEGFAVHENGRALNILDVRPGAAKDTGIDFLLLVDNSGSMYDRFSGSQTRMDFARQALTGFFASLAGSGDQAALGSFNTYLHPLAPLGASTGELVRGLERIERPDRESAYTELYVALERFLPELASARGRKAVIVLSDGENVPFSAYSDSGHPIWGDYLADPDHVIQRYLEEEVTLYAVNFADQRDPDLARMAFETGGTVFEARDAQQLSRVYDLIRERIRSEVRVRVRIPTGTSAERTMTVSYDGQSDDSRFFAPLLLGAPGQVPWWLAALVASLGAGLLAAMFFLKLESPVDKAEVQVVGTRLTVALAPGATVIGSAADAQVTLAGHRGIDQHHATIVHDEKAGTFTLAADRPVRVNNVPVKNRKLKAGDVIDIEGATVIFDTPTKKKG